MPRLSPGVYPTSLYKPENISARYDRNIRIKRDGLCGVAPGGSKVRKPELLPAQAKAAGCGTVFTTGGAAALFAIDLPRN